MLIALVLATHAATGAETCSVAPVIVFRNNGGTYLLGSALPDTVAAGPGRVRPSREGGHWGAGGPRAIYGQVVRVDRFGGKDSATIAQAFARQGSREVVIVPWDYGPDCAEVVWSRSARWVTTDAPGFYRLVPRPQSEWVNGRPVLDAFMADLGPYPHALFYENSFRGAGAARGPQALTAAELFAFYVALPSGDDARLRPDRARLMLDTWERANEDLAAKYPASVSLSLARSELRRK
jgi:hypothetical protein